MPGNILIITAELGLGLELWLGELGSIVLQLSVRQLYNDNYVRKRFKRTDSFCSPSLSRMVVVVEPPPYEMNYVSQKSFKMFLNSPVSIHPIAENLLVEVIL